MPQIRLTVQTLTPLLMYGADNKDDRTNNSIRAEPELRASSIRGILRYWLRAVLGNDKNQTKTIYERESAVLGSTDIGSRVQVRVRPLRSAQIETGQTVLPEQTRGFSLKHTGFIPQSEFRITLSTHALYTGKALADDSPLVKAVFLMTHFGGLGRRARRGSGNLRVLDVKGYEGDLPLDAFPDDRNNLADYIGDIAHFVSQQPLSERPKFPVFAPDTAVVLLGRTTHVDYQNAFDELWRVSGRYHDAGGIFGDVRPRRASAIHMRVSAVRSGFVAQQTILYSGSGAWSKMQDYIERCQQNGFDAIYGNWSDWR